MLIFGLSVLKAGDVFAKEGKNKKSVDTSKKEKLPELTLKKSEFVDLNDPVAQSLKFTEMTKNSEAGSDKCQTCKYFSVKGTSEGKTVGTCTVFQDKYVFENSHCAAFMQKS